MRQFLQPPIQGVVLQTYGAGNGPAKRKDLLALFKEASDNGVLILNITQCMRGHVTSAYAAGKVHVRVPLVKNRNASESYPLMSSLL